MTWFRGPNRAQHLGLTVESTLYTLEIENKQYKCTYHNVDKYQGSKGIRQWPIT